MGNGSFHDNENLSLVNGQANETVTLHEAFNGQGSAPNLTVSELEHITINADGTVTATFDNFSTTCD